MSIYIYMCDINVMNATYATHVMYGCIVCMYVCNVCKCDVIVM